MPKLTKRERSVAYKYKRIQKALERGAASYAEADRLAYSIAKKLDLEHGRIVRISVDGKGLQLIDNYVRAQIRPDREEKDMPKCWSKASSVRQFELKEVSVSKA